MTGGFLRCAVMKIGDRIKIAAEKVGGLDRLAEMIPTVSRRSLSDYVGNKSEPRASIIAQIAQLTSANAGWLITGDGDMFDATQAGMGAASAEITNLDQPDFIRLPMYSDVHASAGPGVVPVTEQANGVVAFGRRFLRDQGAVPEQCSIIWARGTSMEPTIPDGSILVVDHSQSTVEHGCIYVFNVADRLLVKRARWRMDGKLDLVSDNANEVHPIETFAADSVDQLRVVGRLVYFCRAP